MITVFNRKEIYHGFSMEDCYKVRDILSANKIKYDCKVVNLYNSGFNFNRQDSGTLGMNLNYAYDYYVYIHKKDYDLAGYLIRQL